MKRIGWAVLMLGVFGWTVPAAAETWIQWVQQGFVGQPASWEVPVEQRDLFVHPGLPGQCADEE